LKAGRHLDYDFSMGRRKIFPPTLHAAASPSRRTLHAEMLRLCARIGYSPPVSA
jgi:hypothetical protein